VVGSFREGRAEPSVVDAAGISLVAALLTTRLPR
jgi:hypothetical protein